MAEIEHLVGRIYDCAAEPDLWPEVLSELRDAVGAAYVGIGFADFTPVVHGLPAVWLRRNSPWDENWLVKLNGLMGKIPHGANLFKLPVDEAWTQLQQMPEDEFHQTEFYREWVEPQQLRDCLSLIYLKRDHLNGIITMPTSAKREPVTADACRLVEQLSPHIRRAMLINDISDKGRMALTLYRKVLDSLSVAVFVLGLGRRVVFTNAAGESLLETGDLLGLKSGVLAAHKVMGAPGGLDEAIDRALRGDMAIGITGIGVPLVGRHGDRAAAYVLPISGGEVRGAMGLGHCIVFVAQRQEQQPAVVELLRTLFDFTQTEARVASLISQGEGPQAIAQMLGLSIHTVRSHLKHVYAKSRTGDQTALSGLLNSLVPPVLIGPPDGSPTGSPEAGKPAS